MGETWCAVESRVAVVAFVALSGCVFIPTDEQLAANRAVPAPVVPDPATERLPSLETRHFELASADDELIGDMQVLFARYENTFTLIAREHDLGYEELRDANPGVDAWLPGEGTPIYLPTLSVLPDAPRDGIVLNLPSMRLLYFSKAADGGLDVTSHPIGIGREGWATPTGTADVKDKVRDPAWYPPASVRAEHAELGDPLPSVVPPGPDNPLGAYALALSMPGYLIHGTNKPAGVGMRVSHGCIRLYPEDIEALFERVPRGTRVHIVNEPVLAGWRDGELYLEVHRPLAEDDRDLLADAERVVYAAIERAGVDAADPTVGAIDWQRVARIVAEARGIPFPVLGAEGTLEAYLASARIIENQVLPFRATWLSRP
jgi:L,D-transpeptidase ErfK/SrfK